MTVAVVGAGLAGLAAAYELRRGAADVVLLESERRAGGVVRTETQPEGWVVEGGPDSFLDGDAAVAALARELGVAERIIRQSVRGASLWTGSELEPLSANEAAARLGIQASPEDLSATHSSFVGGMGELTAALAAGVASALRLGAGVSGISPGEGGGFRLSITGGATLVADAVILAVPAWHAAHLLRGLAPAAAEILAVIRYHGSTAVNLAYRAEQVRAPLRGTGFVVRHDARSPIRACTFASVKFPGRAPPGHVLLRAFVTAADDPARAAHDALAPILRLDGEPQWTRVHEWARAIPLHAPEDRARVPRARTELARLGPLYAAGAGLDGAGVGACVKSGRAVGRAALEGADVTRRARSAPPASPARP